MTKQNRELLNKKLLIDLVLAAAIWVSAGLILKRSSFTIAGYLAMTILYVTAGYGIYKAVRGRIKGYRREELFQ